MAEYDSEEHLEQQRRTDENLAQREQIYYGTLDELNTMGTRHRDAVEREDTLKEEKKTHMERHPALVNRSFYDVSAGWFIVFLIVAVGTDFLVVRPTWSFLLGLMSVKGPLAWAAEIAFPILIIGTELMVAHFLGYFDAPLHAADIERFKKYYSLMFAFGIGIALVPGVAAFYGYAVAISVAVEPDFRDVLALFIVPAIVTSAHLALVCTWKPQKTMWAKFRYQAAMVDLKKKIKAAKNRRNNIRSKTIRLYRSYCESHARRSRQQGCELAFGPIERSTGQLLRELLDERSLQPLLKDLSLFEQNGQARPRPGEAAHANS